MSKHHQPRAKNRPQLYLPLRPTNHTYSSLDFFAYEETRDSLLRDPRIGRAALLSGGILWRLAVEVVLPDIVLDGPGDLTYAHGLGFTYFDRRGTAYVDDSLTENEIRLIVGTYVRQPQERTNLHGAALPSWWPHPHHFEQSTLNFGFWSPIAENWYCKTRTKYCDGSGQPQTGAEWHNLIRRLDRRARKVTEMAREAALRFFRSGIV